MVTKSVIIFFILILCTPGCERGTIIRDEIEYIDKPHEPCVYKPAPIYLPGEMLYGRVAGLKNCLPFMASAIAGLGNNTTHLMGLSVTTYEDWGNFFADKEFLNIGAKAYGIGVWSLLKDSIPHVYFQTYSTVQDHDVFEDDFRIDTTYNNRIAFTEIDSIDRRIQGWFECRFIIRQPASGHNPDTIIFTDCHFDAREK